MLEKLCYALQPPKGSFLQRIYTLCITAGALGWLLEPSGFRDYFWLMILATMIAENPYYERRNDH